jgi:uncharacterized protein YbjT (DUF2867 family)
MILVAGSTGILGGLVCQRLAESDADVRALTRATSDPAKRRALSALGAELVEGDLRDPASLASACAGVRTVISTVTTTMSKQPGDSIEVTDRDGQLALVEAAEAAGVEHLILVSFNEQATDSPLQQAKRVVEQRLVASSMAYTILRPTMFMEAWLSPALGFDHPNHSAQIYGDGSVGHAWISVADVAGYVVGAIDNAEARDAVLDLGGPEVLSARDAVRIFEDVTGTAFAVTEVPVEALRAQYEGASDSLARSFAAMMLAAAEGSRLDPGPATKVIPLPERATVRQYAERVSGPAPSDAVEEAVE